MRAGAILVLVAAMLSGCGLTQRLGLNNIGFGLGQGRVRSDQTVPYKAALKASPEDPRTFTVSTKDLAVPLDDLRESLRYPATRYCIETFGASDIAWEVDTATGDWTSIDDGSERVYSGRCTAR